jgi:hypothetical protein
MQLRRIAFTLSIALIVALASVAAAQDTISGKYEGVAKSDQIGDIPLTAEIKNDNGKISGKIDSPQGQLTITSGTFVDGKLTMKFDAGGNEGTVTATIQGDKIIGKWELAGQGGPLELKKVGSAATTASATPATSGDPVSGDWDATADAGGQTIPFVLKLKLSGETVTGSSETAQGKLDISKGTYKDGKLSFVLAMDQGALTMTGMIKEGKIAGDFDFAGQMQGKWEAKKK